jgi:hypothetical protein
MFVNVLMWINLVCTEDVRESVGTNFTSPCSVEKNLFHAIYVGHQNQEVRLDKGFKIPTNLPNHFISCNRIHGDGHMQSCTNVSERYKSSPANDRYLDLWIRKRSHHVSMDEHQRS